MTGTVQATGAAEVIERARTLADALVARQAETERRTRYAPDVHEAFTEAGLYRILVPPRYGGYGLGAHTFLRVAATIARGCPSTGWMYLFASAHALPVATLFPPEAQDELFGDGHFLCPATVAPSGTAERSDGGWTLTGSWRYASGSPYATHFLGHVLVPPPGGDADDEPVPMMFIAPRDRWRLEDDWGGQLGLRGSGSNTVVLERAFVPDRYTLPGHLSQLSVTDDAPGRSLHGPGYGGGPLSFMLLELGALAVGIAYGALDAYSELMRTRTTLYPPIVPRTEDPDYQFRYGEAAAMIHTAEAAVLHAAREWDEACARGAAAFTRDEELRLALVAREAVRLCWRAVESQLVPTAGSSALVDGARFARVWRDLSMLHGHGGLGVFLSLIANRDLARLRFGQA
ncbi:acyl-CoA dehydrogenase family protein [Actinomadura flavalba]|uniref:acyl-CoA dehydrogenase family protein n=1 Tax=Actinomadura flavalba TaxID=1120938 RepID=UPI00037D5FD9|nr:acyl-CoA dehydrogenase family protein [Actinomadura flavalba]